MKATNFLLVALALTIMGCMASDVRRAKRAQPSANIKVLHSDWELIVDSIDDELGREKQGLQPDAGVATWREYWVWRMRNLRKTKWSDQANAYIHQRRSQMGLPPVNE
jgi:hypothetical protein